MRADKQGISIESKRLYREEWTGNGRGSKSRWSKKQVPAFETKGTYVRARDLRKYTSGAFSTRLFKKEWTVNGGRSRRGWSRSKNEVLVSETKMKGHPSVSAIVETIPPIQ
jgi:hypothetical protein